MTAIDGPIISVTNATVVIDGAEILHTVNWSVAAGCHCFVLGANGSGKSTLMNLVMGFSWPRLGGQVRVLGHLYGACDLQSVRREIGWVSAYLQDWTLAHMPALNVVMSGFDATIGLYREPTGAERDRAAAELAKVGCGPLLERRFETLSSGEQMKVLIARANVNAPRILILDEPCCHLDLYSREQFLQVVADFVNCPEAPTVVMVTHRVDDITPQFGSGIVMQAGEIVAAGDRETVLTESVLQAAFGMPVRLKLFNDRFWPYV